MGRQPEKEHGNAGKRVMEGAWKTRETCGVGNGGFAELDGHVMCHFMEGRRSEDLCGSGVGAARGFRV